MSFRRVFSSSAVRRVALVSSVGCALYVARPMPLRADDVKMAPHQQQQSNITTTPVLNAPDPALAPYYTPTFGDASRLPSSSDCASLPYDKLVALYKPESAPTDGPISLDKSWWQKLFSWTQFGGQDTEPVLPAIPLIFTSNDPDPDHRHFELVVRSAQNRICNHLLEIEQRGGQQFAEGEEKTAIAPGRFINDVTIRGDGSGGGIVRVLQGGSVFSKAGINTSVAYSKLPTKAFERLQADHPSIQTVAPPKSGTFNLFTASISLVIHARSPMVPTSHANYRFFELDVDGNKYWWFGGGADLTPTYVVDEDASTFHRTLKRVCDRFSYTYYPEFKQWCDKYFWITHRKENRGVGGVFFDDLHTAKKQHYSKFMNEMAQTFPSLYFPIVLKRKDERFTRADVDFQELRRGRYAEFNLVYDKGTSFGLQQPTARPEAILMSLPPIAQFTYKQEFKGDKQLYTKDVLEKPRKWA